ncbi:hypothetical protein [Deinococcus sp. YIM 77859]|uniref:hypothetical protein n=1 Tax=Deinococcus sp. YIM 77859 TaxID=1540221 RepID=UPI001E4B69C5|nr:hypothetical protein [Deinococcus sp. YIM 77859]
MKRVMAALALAGAWGGTAGAASLDFGAAYRTGGGGLLRAGVSNVAAGPGTVAAAVSNRAVEASVTRGLSLPPAGAASARVDAALTWQGGLRLSTDAAGTLGPVALNLGAALFTVRATAVDPLAAWSLAPTDLRVSGWNAGFTARYRVNRTLVALVGGEFGPQNHLLGGVEWRRDLTRVLPPAEGEAPEGEPETERTGTLALRLGARAGRDVLGVTGGVTYSTEAGFGLALDVLAGPGPWGVVGSLSAPDVWRGGARRGCTSPTNRGGGRVHPCGQGWRAPCRLAPAPLASMCGAARGAWGRALGTVSHWAAPRTRSLRPLREQ